MERILTFAEFSKSFDKNGQALGNTESDVKTLAAAADNFTAPTENGEGCGDTASMTPAVVGEPENIITVEAPAEEPESEEVLSVGPEMIEEPTGPEGDVETETDDEEILNH